MGFYKRRTEAEKALERLKKGHVAKILKGSEGDTGGGLFRLDRDGEKKKAIQLEQDQRRGARRRSKTFPPTE